MANDNKKEPVEVLESSTAITDSRTDTGSPTKDEAVMPSSFPSFINNSIINSKEMLDLILLLIDFFKGKRGFRTKTLDDGSSVSYIQQYEKRNTGNSPIQYAIDWKRHPKADVFRDMITDGLLEQYIPAEDIRGLRLSRDFSAAIYNSTYQGRFTSDIEFVNFEFMFSVRGVKLNKDIFHFYKRTHP